ncbi:hypothetical protein [Microcella sp.]|uniref:hypothetical protein n=1 Tax=Microcella sp. TaxID=1913979 RepID=UPI003918D160
MAVVSMGTLEIAIDIATYLAMSVDGFSPHQSWGLGSLAIPELTPAEVRFEPMGFDYSSGVGYRYLDSETWPTTYDESSGWLCVGDVTASRAFVITTGTALSIEDGVMTAIWLLPEMTR